MGLLRGGLIIIITIALFLSIIGTNLFFTLNLSSTYENVESTLKEVIDVWAAESGAKSFIVNNYGLMEKHCQRNETYQFNFNEIEMTIPCEIIELGAKKTLDYFLEETPSYFYYKNYNCEFKICLEENENSLVILSKTGKDYWKKNFYNTLIITFVLIGLIFVLTKEKRNTFYITGIVTFLAAYPFKKINWLFSIVPDFVPLSYLPTIFSKSNFVYQTTLIIGITIFAIGFLMGVISGIKKGLSFFKWIKEKLKQKKEPEKIKKPKENTKISKKDILKKLNFWNKSQKNSVLLLVFTLTSLPF